MKKPTIFNYENRITKFRYLKQNLKKEFDKNHIRYSGINAIDDLIQGFDSGKRYTIVSCKGMAALSLVKSIFENFSLIYVENFNIDGHLLELTATNNQSFVGLEEPTMKLLLNGTDYWPSIMEFS